MKNAYKNPEIVVKTKLEDPPWMVHSGRSVGDNPILECPVCGHTEEVEYLEYHRYGPFHCMNCDRLNKIENAFYNVAYVFNGNSHHCGLYIGNFLL